MTAIDIESLKNKVPPKLAALIEFDRADPIAEFEKIKIKDDKLFVSVYVHAFAFLLVYKYSKPTGNVMKNSITYNDYAALKELVEGGE